MSTRRVMTRRDGEKGISKNTSPACSARRQSCARSAVFFRGAPKRRGSIPRRPRPAQPPKVDG